jgi:lipopolysaccharide heptosyltransferase I
VTPATRPTSRERVLVIRLGAMGDVVHTLAAVTALRRGRPELQIGWVIEDRWSDLLCARNAPRSGPRTPQRPVADFVHLVDTKRWRKAPFSRETRLAARNAWREIRDQGYGVAADFQGAVKSALIARFAGTETVAGFSTPRETPARIFYSDRVASHGIHVVEQYHSLAERIAKQALPRFQPEFPRDPEAEASANARLFSVGKEFALINPGAGWGAKQWPAERYGEVARELAISGMAPLINYGPTEHELALRVREASGGAAELISCSISELIALTRRAQLFIGGDTGPLHLAAAFGVPVVAIFGPTDPARNGPYGTRSAVLRSPASETSSSHTSTPDPGLLSITVDEVVVASRQLLERPGA